MSDKHSNISIFVPHIGCPNQCSFCNQVHITGQSNKPSSETVHKAVAVAKSSKNYNPKNTEIAFFGGSFTVIDRAFRIELLQAAGEYVKNGDVCGIRISTRPDAIDCDILAELKEYGVTAIELGAQSMDNEVLRINRRGHSREAVVKASKLIKAHGFSLGLQMMTGLYGDSNQKAVNTAWDLAELSPDTVRIYPTIVLEGTYLCELYRKGEYTPQTVEEAVELCCKIIPIFKNRDIRIIRLGLHSIDEMAYVAGPWHPAFGELVESGTYRLLAEGMLKNHKKGNYSLYVNEKEISKLVGQHRSNLEHFKKLGYLCRVKPAADLELYNIRIEENS